MFEPIKEEEASTGECSVSFANSKQSILKGLKDFQQQLQQQELKNLQSEIANILSAVSSMDGEFIRNSTAHYHNLDVKNSVESFIEKISERKQQQIDTTSDKRSNSVIEEPKEKTDGQRSKPKVEEKNKAKATSGILTSVFGKILGGESKEGKAFVMNLPEKQPQKRYDPVKKRWVFEGEEEEPQKVAKPPPKLLSAKSENVTSVLKKPQSQIDSLTAPPAFKRKGQGAKGAAKRQASEVKPQQAQPVKKVEELLSPEHQLVDLINRQFYGLSQSCQEIESSLKQQLQRKQEQITEALNSLQQNKNSSKPSALSESESQSLDRVNAQIFSMQKTSQELTSKLMEVNGENASERHQLSDHHSKLIKLLKETSFINEKLFENQQMNLGSSSMIHKLSGLSSNTSKRPHSFESEQQTKLTHGKAPFKYESAESILINEVEINRVKEQNSELLRKQSLMAEQIQGLKAKLAKASALANGPGQVSESPRENESKKSRPDTSSQLELEETKRKLEMTETRKSEAELQFQIINSEAQILRQQCLNLEVQNQSLKTSLKALQERASSKEAILQELRSSQEQIHRLEADLRMREVFNHDTISAHMETLSRFAQEIDEQMAVISLIEEKRRAIQIFSDHESSSHSSKYSEKEFSGGPLEGEVNDAQILNTTAANPVLDISDILTLLTRTYAEKYAQMQSCIDTLVFEKQSLENSLSMQLEKHQSERESTQRNMRKLESLNQSYKRDKRQTEQRLVELETEVQKQKKKNQHLQKEEAYQKQLLQQAMNSSQNSAEASKKVRFELNESLRQISDLQRQIDTFKRINQNQKEEVKRLSEEVSQLEGIKLSYQRQQKELKSSVSALNAQIEEDTNKFSRQLSILKTKHQQQLQELVQEQSQKSQNTEKALKARIRAQEQKSSELQQKQQQFSVQIGRQQRAVQRLEKENEELRQEKVTLQQRNTKLSQQIDQSQMQIQSLEEKLLSLPREFERKINEIEVERRQLQELVQQVESQKLKETQQKESIISQLKATLQQAEQSSKQTVKQLQAVFQELRLEFDELERQKLSLENSFEQSVQLASSIKTDYEHTQHDFGKITESFSARIDQLLKDNSHLTMQLTDYSQLARVMNTKIEELEAFKDSHSKAVSENQKKDSEVLELLEIVEQKSTEIQSLSKDYSQLYENYDAVSAENAQNRDIKQSLEAAQERSSVLEQELSQMRQNERQLSEQKGELEDLIQELNQQLQDLIGQQNSRESQREGKVEPEQVTQFQKQLRDSEELYNRLKSEAEEERAQTEELISSMNEEIIQLEGRVQEKEQELKQQKEQRGQQINQKQQQLNALKNGATESSERCKQIQKQVEEREMLITELSEDLEAAQSKVTNLEGQNVKLSAQVALLNQQVSQLEQKLTGVELRQGLEEKTPQEEQLESVKRVIEENESQMQRLNSKINLDFLNSCKRKNMEKSINRSSGDESSRNVSEVQSEEGSNVETTSKLNPALGHSENQQPQEKEVAADEKAKDNQPQTEMVWRGQNDEQPHKEEKKSELEKNLAEKQELLQLIEGMSEELRVKDSELEDKNEEIEKLNQLLEQVRSIGESDNQIGGGAPELLKQKNEELSSTIVNLKDELVASARELQEKETEIQNEKMYADILKEELTQIKNIQTNLSEEHRNLQSELAKYRAKAEEALKARSRGQEQDVSEKKPEVDAEQLTLIIEGMEEDLKAKDLQITRLKETVVKLEAQGTENNSQAKQQSESELQLQLEKILEGLQDSLKQAQVSLRQKQKEIQDLNSLLEAQEQQKGQTQTKLNAATSEIEQLSDKINLLLKEKEDSDNKLVTLTQEVTELKGLNEALRRETHSKNTEISEAVENKGKVGVSQMSQNGLKAELEEAYGEIRNRKIQIDELRKNLVDIDSLYKERQQRLQQKIVSLEKENASVQNLKAKNKAIKDSLKQVQLEASKAAEEKAQLLRINDRLEKEILSLNKSVSRISPSELNTERKHSSDKKLQKTQSLNEVPAGDVKPTGFFGSISSLFMTPIETERIAKGITAKK